MIFDTFSYTTKGGRNRNEDSVAVKHISDGILCVTADGLGGLRFGDTASNIVVDSFMDAEEPDESCDIRSWLESRVIYANHRVLEFQDRDHCNIGSTAAVLLIKHGTAYRVHVGDSRLYYLHNRRIADVTEDHSVAYKKYKAGEITRVQIATDEDQSSLLRTIGNKTRFQPEISSSVVEPGDGFVICSDGFWEYVFDNEILFDFLKADSAQKWVELMLMRAMERIRPGNDNLSVITVLVK